MPCSKKGLTTQHSARPVAPGGIPCCSVACGSRGGVARGTVTNATCTRSRFGWSSDLLTMMWCCAAETAAGSAGRPRRRDRACNPRRPNPHQQTIDVNLLVQGLAWHALDGHGGCRGMRAAVGAQPTPPKKTQNNNNKTPTHRCWRGATQPGRRASHPRRGLPGGRAGERQKPPRRARRGRARRTDVAQDRIGRRSDPPRPRHSLS